MQNQALVFLLALSFSSYAQVVEKVSTEASVFVKASVQRSTHLDSLWKKVTTTSGGCLIGMQHYRPGQQPVRGCVFYGSNDWRVFFRNDPAQIGPFLVAQLSDTTTTTIHTCPFFSASAGELAVYCLQKVYRINWYDFESFQTYNGREITSSNDQPQRWLQAILEDETQRMVMVDHWNQQIKSGPLAEE
ncbi:MAG: hypothetical protein AAGH79_10875 [Bacteroidota bacterium]